MSLLLDALRRAEQEKMSRHPEQRLALSEAPQAASSASPLELQPVTPPPAQPSMGRGDAAAAQTMFSAKTARQEPASRNRGALWAAGGAIGVVILAAAGYVWYSVKLLTPPPVTAKIRPRPPAAPTPAPGSSEPSSASKMEALMQPGANANLRPLPTQPASPAANPASAAPSPPAAAAMTPDQAALMKLLKEAPAAAQPEPLRLARSTESSRVPAEVGAGYEALRNGDYVTARRRYTGALAADATNLDALLGLATLEARSGNRGAAAAHYRRALDLDSRNPTAVAGMAALADTARPEAVEAQLRTDAARSPQSAALQFALGNVFVAQSRWSEAQAAYFEAHRLDPGNADILYNLAVTLDHLGQSRLAAEYYGRALDAARGQASQFDPAPVSRRLAELRP
jgi:tetratricopeptide (TPR) repeat protein